jgi:cysteine synthase A
MASESTETVASSVLDLIGGTDLVELHSVVPRGHGRVLVKLEMQNPTGSMKDRMALAMVDAAAADGRLPPNGCVVEYTGGSTGVSLAQVCAAMGLRAHIVTSDAFSIDKRRHMELFGAELTVVESDRGQMDEALTRTMIAVASEIADRTGAYWTDQLNNADQILGYRLLGEEIWAQTAGSCDAFVQCVGTAGSLMGIGASLREHDPVVQLVAVEPAESAVLSGSKSGAHQIEGVGAGFVVPLWQSDMVDRIISVSTDDAIAMTRRLASEEQVVAGTSTGANVLAALSVAKSLGPGSTTVTLACDSGTKYFHTELHQRSQGDSKPITDTNGEST